MGYVSKVRYRGLFESWTQWQHPYAAEKERNPCYDGLVVVLFALLCSFSSISIRQTRGRIGLAIMGCKLRTPITWHSSRASAPSPPRWGLDPRKQEGRHSLYPSACPSLSSLTPSLNLHKVYEVDDCCSSAS